jgi:acetoin utilization protein AcuB
VFVANRMTKNPTTVLPTDGIDKAAELMKKGHFRRLPVVDEEEKLVGFLTDKDIMRVSPSPATTLSRYEITTLLSKLKRRRHHGEERFPGQ